MHRCPCHQAKQLPCRASNSTSSSFSSFITCIVNALLPAVRWVLGDVAFFPSTFYLLLSACESVREGGGGQTPAGGATSSLSCGPVTWASTSGGTAREEAGECLVFIRREAVKMISQLTFVPLLCQYQQFCFNTSWLRGSIAVMTQNTLTAERHQLVFAALWARNRPTLETVE